MQIVKQEFTKKNKYNVYLSNGEVLNLQEQVITENELLLKKEMSQELYNKLVRDNKIYELMEMAVKYISIRLRSIKEVKDYLLKKGGSNNEVEDAVQKLIESGYLDDDRFTKAFIKDKLKFTTIGDYKIKMQLNKLGVSTSIIEDNMNKIDEHIIEEKIKKIIEKDKKTNKKYSGQILKNKIYNHLLNQGYSQEKVITIINKYDFQYKIAENSKNISGDDKMKKILGVFIFLLLLVGCSLSNSPTSKVEDLLSKYQSLDSDIKNGIDNVLEEETLTNNQKERYRKLIEKQYKNLTYQIKDEKIDGDTAIITTEIEVLDYKKATNETSTYYSDKKDYTVEEYNDTKLNNLEKIKDKVTYTIDFEVKKDKDGNWQLSSLNNETIKKIQGMY